MSKPIDLGAITAYGLWIDAGNVGTIDDFLASLKGEKGDTGAQGPKGDTGAQGEPGPTGLGVPTPTADDAGKVPAVNAAGDGYDLVVMSGGGGTTDREWTLLGTVDCSVASGNIEFTDLDDFTEFWILSDTVKNASDTASAYDLMINGVQILKNAVAINNQKLTTNDYRHLHCKFDRLFWECRTSSGAISGTNTTPVNGNAQFPYNVIKNVGAAKTFKLSSPMSAYCAVSGTIEIYGR